MKLYQAAQLSKRRVMEMCYTKSDAVNTWKAIYFIQDTITNRINSSGKCGV